MFIEEEVLVQSNETLEFVKKGDKIKPISEFISQKTSTKFVFLVHHYGENENDLRDIQAFGEYSKARKFVNNRVKRKNNTVDKKWKNFNNKDKQYFTEKYPDQWSNGNEWVKIMIMEIKNN